MTDDYDAKDAPGTRWAANKSLLRPISAILVFDLSTLGWVSTDSDAPTSSTSTSAMGDLQPAEHHERRSVRTRIEDKRGGDSRRSRRSCDESLLAVRLRSMPPLTT